MASGEAERAARDRPGPSTARPAQATSSVPAAEPFSSMSRNNGISFSALPDVSIHDYIKAFSATTPAECIISASRISNQRIAVYLKSKENVFNAINNGLTFNNSFIQINPLTLPTTRLTLSNVYPEIPNQLLTKQISAFCKVVSPIKPIPLGFKDKNLSHILSFRRQVQVLIPPNVTPPNHLNFSHAGATYRVFLSTDAVRCFECGEFGHVSRLCKKGVSEKGKSDSKHPPKSSTNLRSEPMEAPQRVPTHEDTDRAGPSRVDADRTGPSLNTERTGPSHNTERAGPSRANADRTSSSRATPDRTDPSHSDTDRVDPSHTNTDRAGPSHANNTPAPNTSYSLGGEPGTSSDPCSSSDTVLPGNSSNKSPSRDLSSHPPSIWGSPPNPTRLFSEVVAKRKQGPVMTSMESSSLTPLESSTPPRKVQKKVSSPTISLPSSPAKSRPPTPTPSNPPSSTNSSPVSSQDTTITDVTMGEDPQDTDDESVDWASSFPSSQGPLSDKELISFLKHVKSRKKPIEVARRFTSNIHGLVRQLRPLRNSPLFKKSTQQRIHKLINKLDDCV